ncbi:MAG: LamG domain-containing protein [Sedimentisphaerales bacterium]
MREVTKRNGFTPSPIYIVAAKLNKAPKTVLAGCRNAQPKCKLVRGFSLVEMMIAFAIIVIIFAAIVPQFRAIRNSWTGNEAKAETIQNGRILAEHITRSLAAAKQIVSVTLSSNPNGSITFQDSNNNQRRYMLSGGYVVFGAVGSEAQLAGPVDRFQIICYSLSDLNTPTTDANIIRLVQVDTDFPNDDVMGTDKTFTTSAYLQTNANTGGGLVGWWKLDETSGTTAADSSGSGNNGTLTNMSAPGCWGAGQIGGSLYCDGINDYVDCGNAASLDITGAITLAAWVKTNDAGNNQYNYFVGKGDTSYAIQHQSSNQIEFFIYDSGAWYNTWYALDSSFNGVWHHLAGTYDGSILRLYVDGTEQDTKAHIGSIKSTAYNVFIGENSQETGAYYNGNIDDVRIYNRALDANEIALLANTLKYMGFTEAKAPVDTNTSIAVPIPTGTSSGDLLIAAVAADGNPTISTPAGWTLINQGANGSAVTLGAWWKIAGASESAPNFTWTGGQQAYGWMMRFTGHNSTNPIDACSTADSTSATPTSPAVTTTVANCLILRLGAFDDSGITVDSPGLSDPCHTAITMDKSASGGGSGLTAGLAGYWNLDETSGTTAADSSGNGNTGTLQGSPLPTWAAGKYGNCLSFASGGGRVYAPSSSTIDFADEDFSVALWAIQPTSWSGQYELFIKGTMGVGAYPGTGKRYELYRKNAQFRFCVDDNVTKSDLALASSGFCTGSWVHIVAVRDTAANKLRLYANGVLKGTVTDSTGSISQNEPLYIADLEGLFTGKTDDVRIYDRVLSADDVNALYQWSGDSGTVSGGAGYVSQATTGLSSGTPTFSLGSAKPARMLTIAIAPADVNNNDDIRP